MRKNGINKSFVEIAGGLCAPKGFKAGGVFDALALGILISDRCCPTACVFSENYEHSPSALVSKRHLKYGSMSAVLVNSSVAGLFIPDGETSIEKACRLLAKYTGVSAGETVVISAGEIGCDFSLTAFERSASKLVGLLSDNELGSKNFTLTLENAHEFAYAVDLGDVPCKIGGVFKNISDGSRAEPTKIVLLTTDIHISSEMLQKALSAVVKDTLDMLFVDGLTSPSDTVCIMANGKAGNYKISTADSEYDKFVHILKEVLLEIRRRIAYNIHEKGYAFECNVFGMKSKQSAWGLAKKLSSSVAIKNALASGNIEAKNLLYEISSAVKDLNFEKIKLSVNGVTLFAEGFKFPLGEDAQKRLREERTASISVYINEGNYSATALGRFC